MSTTGTPVIPFSDSVFFICIREVRVSTKRRNIGELFYDLNTLADSEQSSMDKANAIRNIHLTRDFDMDEFYPVINTLEVRLPNLSY